MQKIIYHKSRNEAREAVKNGWGDKVIDNGADAGQNRWTTVIEIDEPGTQSISTAEVQNLKQSLLKTPRIKSINIIANKAANAGPVVNRDNSRVLVSRRKREGTYKDREWNKFIKAVECALEAVKETGCTIKQGFNKAS